MPPKTAKKPAQTPLGVAKIIADIRACRDLLAVAIEDVQVKFRAGHEIRRRQAQEDLVALHSALLEATVPSRLVAIFATGPDAVVAAAGEVVKEGGIVLKADAIWRRIAAEVEPSFGPQRQWGSAQWHLMMQATAEIARELGYEAMTSLPMENEVVVDTAADVADYARTLVSASPDISDFQIRYCRAEILGRVVTDDLGAATVPVVVIAAAPEEVTSLRRLFGRAILHVFSPDDVPDRESMAEIFRAATPS